MVGARSSSRGDSDVGGDEQFLECLDRLDVDGARAAIRGIGAAHDIVEARDDLLCGAGEPLADPIENTHTSILLRLTPSVAAST